MTNVSNSPLPHALNVNAVMQAQSLSVGCSIAWRLINPFCLPLLAPAQAEAVRENCLRQIRFELRSSAMLRQIAKALDTPVLVVDPRNPQGGFINKDLALEQHPAVDLHPSAAIDVVIDGQLRFGDSTLNAGDALLRRQDQQFEQLSFDNSTILRNVFYLPIAMFHEQSDAK